MRLVDAPELTRTWLACAKPNPEAPTKLVCLHHAGGSPASFRPWAEQVPDSLELLAVRLPGRDARLRERPATSVAEIVEPLARALAPVVVEHDVSIFGHSLGALLGFELARELRRQRLPSPTALIVSGRSAPRPGARHLALHALDDAELVAAVQRIYGGIPAAILAEPELLALTLPVLRADLRIHETHALTDEPPLEVPIVALGGDADPLVDRAGLEAWAVHTSAGFRCAQSSGDHFYLATPAGRAWVVEQIAAMGC